ncbi:MAG TPA: dolichyl-phosphate beta-glucosyltransferase [Acidimicrobiales bacterium]|jgi:putative flippase GtrA|nr:dolichyl-phosphate beta-glucosyltransferase [Acidimicrobiales bacterium]
MTALETEPPAMGEMRSDPRRVPLDVEIVVPVYNEAPHLAERVTELRRFLDQSFPFRAVVTVVDNASTDGTFAVATQLAETTPGVAALYVPRKGRGHALRTAWSTSTAPVVAYMDVDLSTSLSALLPLVAPLLSGHRDVAIGTRLARGAHVVRGTKRELISRAYNLLLKLFLRGRFSDAQCGFKALRREAALQILPLVQDEEWFFDTELLITAERLGLRISEVPVDWVDDPDSRVRIVQTALNDLRGVWRISHGRGRDLTRRPSSGPSAAVDQVAADQLMRFAGVGAISTLGYLFLFVAWRPLAGSFGANTLALAICTFFNMAVHRELAGTRGAPRSRFALAAAALFLLSLGLTTVALVVAQVVMAGSLPVQLLAVTAANAVAAVLRFAVLRAWVFRPDSSSVTNHPEATS